MGLSQVAVEGRKHDVIDTQANVLTFLASFSPPNVLDTWVHTFGIKPIGTADDD